MEDLRLKRLHQSVIELISNANNAAMSTRKSEVYSLHVAAYMDIDKTTHSLYNILAYKKELALTMLRCSDEEQMKIHIGTMKYLDDMICKVLGVYEE